MRDEPELARSKASSPFDFRLPTPGICLRSAFEGGWIMPTYVLLTRLGEAERRRPRLRAAKGKKWIQAIH